MQGSGSIKAGLCGGDLPECVLQNCVGRPKHDRVMAGAAELPIERGRSQPSSSSSSSHKSPFAFPSYQSSCRLPRAPVTSSPVSSPGPPPIPICRPIERLALVNLQEVLTRTPSSGSALMISRASSDSLTQCLAGCVIPLAAPHAAHAPSVLESRPPRPPRTEAAGCHALPVVPGAIIVTISSPAQMPFSVVVASLPSSPSLSSSEFARLSLSYRVLDSLGLSRLGLSRHVLACLGLTWLGILRQALIPRPQTSFDMGWLATARS